jgi:hypothetical protein
MLTMKSTRLASMLATTFVAALLLSGTAAAQMALPETARLVLPAQPVQAPDATVRVDESALYYYAQNNQHERVEAEVRRLRSLNPGWNPPADLYHGGGYNQDQGLWDMFAAQEIAAIHEEIARRYAQEPGWQPPLELVQALDRVETRRRLLSAFETGHSHSVIATLENEPVLLDGDDLEVLWVAGSAYAKEEHRTTATQIFDVAMRAVDSPDELRGTLYNARDALPVGDVASLLSTGQALHGIDPDYAPVFNQFQLDLHRDQLGAELEIWRVNPDRSHALSESSIAALTANWAGNGASYNTPADLSGEYELVGWAQYAKGEPRAALELFRRALGSAHMLREGTAARYGAALSMRDLGNAEGALNLLAAGLPDPSVGSPLTAGNDDRPMALCIELLSNALYGLEDAIALNPQRVARHTHYVSLLESASGAEALGWYAYRSEQLSPASAWFEKSLEWRPSASAVEGLARSTWRQGERSSTRTLIERYGARFPAIATLGTELEASRQPAAQSASRTSRSSPAQSSALANASQAQRAGNPRRCLSILQSAPASAQAALIRGWCLLDLDRSHEAAEAFSSVVQSASGATQRDAGYGQALAMLRQGRTFDALTIARATDLSEDQRAIIARSALADQANQAFNAGHYGDALAALDRRQRFAAEPRDLALLRAWSLLRLNAVQEARSLFLALDQQLSTRQTQRGLAALPQSFGTPLFGNR